MTHINYWLDTLYQYKNKEDFKITLVGDKVDLIKDRNEILIKIMNNWLMNSILIYLPFALYGEKVNEYFKPLLQIL